MQRFGDIGRRKRIALFLLPIIICVLLFAIDLVTKLVIINFKNTDKLPITVIKGFFSLIYVENTGAAFSFLSDFTWAHTFFMILTPVALIAFAICYFIIGKRSWVIKYGIVSVFAGTLGNYVDRIFRGYVVDFLSFDFGTLGKFATFNFADSCICVGFVLVLIHFLFLDKDALFRFSKGKFEDSK